MQLELVYQTGPMLRLVELAGRTCYRSEGRITDDSAAGFVDRIVSRGHESVVEHSNLVFRVREAVGDVLLTVLRLNRYISCIVGVGGEYYLSGNVRMFKDLLRRLQVMPHDDEPIRELSNQLIAGFYRLPAPFFSDFVSAGWMESERFVDDKEAPNLLPQVIYEAGGQVVELLNLDRCDAMSGTVSPHDLERLMTCSVRITTSRDSSLQEVRHRPAAYSQESQRYVDLQNRLSYVHPTEIPSDEAFSLNLSDTWRDKLPDGVDQLSLTFDEMMQFVHTCYTAMREAGYKPEVARGILPNATTTTMVITRSLAEWRHYLKLRTDAKAQRPIRERAESILAYLSDQGWLEGGL